jgi:hypothetical protein
MATTNIDLIKDRLMDTYLNCASEGLFLTPIDASIFEQHIEDLASTLDIIVEEFEVEPDPLTELEARGGDFKELSWR